MITSTEFARRRQLFMANMIPASIAIISGAKEVTRSRDTEYAFRQDSSFFYLTGFNEPDAVLVLAPALEQSVILFCKPKDRQAEIWQGRRLGPEQAVLQLGVDAAYSVAELDEKMPLLINGHQQLYYPMGQYEFLDSAVTRWSNTLRNAPKKGHKAPAVVLDSRVCIDEMRLIKSADEIQVMSRACEISAEAHVRVMKFIKPGVTEYQIEAEIQHHFAFNGARHPAYGTIVGGGNNATILHYTENSDSLIDGDLLLVDAGCELQGYAADITRTFPVNGRFSKPQAELYQLVLDAQLAALSLYQPGNTLKMANDEAILVITQGLVDLGILHGEVEQLISEQAYKAFYMHGLGHWLGLDVHDVGDYQVEEGGAQQRPFEAGMVLTIEPGIYIDLDADAPAQYRGIGIRIEDDILITETGHQVLTADVPKSIADIEALMAHGG